MDQAQSFMFAQVASSLSDSLTFRQVVSSLSDSAAAPPQRALQGPAGAPDCSTAPCKHHRSLEKTPGSALKQRHARWTACPRLALALTAHRTATSPPALVVSWRCKPASGVACVSPVCCLHCWQAAEAGRPRTVVGVGLGEANVQQHHARVQRQLHLRGGACYLKPERAPHRLLRVQRSSSWPQHCTTICLASGAAQRTRCTAVKAVQPQAGTDRLLALGRVLLCSSHPLCRQPLCCQQPP